MCFGGGNADLQVKNFVVSAAQIMKSDIILTN